MWVGVRVCVRVRAWVGGGGHELGSGSGIQLGPGLGLGLGEKVRIRASAVILTEKSAGVISRISPFQDALLRVQGAHTVGQREVLQD